MNSKLLVFIGFIAFVNAGAVVYQAPSHGWQAQPQPWSPPKQQGWKQESHGWEQPANYEFNYHVDDQHTKDIKAHHEKAENGAVHGQYWLIDSDGHKRIVDYTADDHHGFQATVRREHTDVIVPIPQQKAHGWEAPRAHWEQKPGKIIVLDLDKTTFILLILAQHGWQAPKAHGWEAPKAHGWEAPKAHGWEQKPGKIINYNSSLYLNLSTYKNIYYLKISAQHGWQARAHY